MLSLKKTFLCTLLCCALSALSGQDAGWENLLAERVNALASQVTSPMEIVIPPPVLRGTGSVSVFSRHLYQLLDILAARNDQFRVIPDSLFRVSSPGAASPGVLQGWYAVDERRGSVEVTLTLKAPDGHTTASAGLVIPRGELEMQKLSLFPDNIKNSAQAQAWESLLTPLDSLRNDELRIHVKPHSETYAYYEGDALGMSLQANRDCYFTVYHINANQELQLIYPNPLDEDNFLPAGQEIALPHNSRFDFTSPFGQESVLVIASPSQFPSLANRPPVKVTRERINAVSRSGARLTAARFNISVLGKARNSMEFTYRKPGDMTETLRLIQREVASQGGWFTGDDLDGSFSSSDFSGNYRVRGETIFLTLERYRNQDLLFTNRGRAREHIFRFSFQKPHNIAEAVHNVRTGILANGGRFTGDEREGSFQASGISGEYRVEDNVDVTIIDKPFIIPNTMIEKEVKNFFGVR